MHIFMGDWLRAREFEGRTPIDVFHRESENRDVKSAHPPGLRDFHMTAGRDFEIDGDYDRVYAELTADDYYKLYVNGEKAAQGPAPGYYFAYNWNRVELTSSVKKGTNSLRLDVYYQGLINRVWNSGDLRMGFICDIYGEKGENRELLLRSDESFDYFIDDRYLPAPTVGYETQYMENFELRAENPLRQSCARWADCDYFFADEPCELLEVYERAPVLSEPIEGGMFFDFGEEITAALKIEAIGTKGGVITLFCGEETDETPLRVRHNMRCGCDYTDTLTFVSDGAFTHEQYDYKAFRYAAVCCAGDAKLLKLTAVCRHHSFDDDACVLRTNDERLARIFALCKNTVKCGSQEVYVDCPSREKGQYAGDMTVTGASQLWLTGDTRLLRKAIENQIQSSSFCPGMAAVAPGSLMQEIADYSLQFPILALRLWEADGDRAFLARCLEESEKLIAYFRQYERPDGLLDGVTGKWNLVDWPANLRDGYDFPLTKPIGSGCHNVINAFYTGCVGQVEQMRDILGVSGEKRYDSLISAFNDAFFDRVRGVYTDSERGSHASLHSNILAPFYGFQPAGSEKTISALIMEKGLCCGVYMSYFLLKSLCRMGFYSEAYSLMTGDGEHSWMNMLREGATSCFEAWGKDQKWNTSLCHPWATAPVPLLIEDFLGFRLDGAKGETHLPHGTEAEITFGGTRGTRVRGYGGTGDTQAFEKA